VRITVLAGRFVHAVVAGNGRFGYPLDTTVACDKGEDRVLGSADLDASCLVEEGDGAMGEVNGVGAEAAIEESGKYERGHSEAKRETGQAMI
jgi:hypothetical protein